MKIAYFGFDLFYDCIEEIYNGGNEIIKIFTCKVDGVFESNEKIYAFAAAHNIEITSEKVVKSDITELINSGCELLFSAGYYFKIPIDDKLVGVNIHPAILPIGRGPWPQPITILKGLTRTGVTLHKLASDFDSGDILHVVEFDVNKNENLLTINDRYMECACKVTRDFLKSPDYYFLNSAKQSKGEYWQEPSIDDMTFSLTDDYKKIDSITRAFYGYGCFLKSGNVTKKILKSRCFTDKPNCDDVEEIIAINGGWLAILKYA